jgi:hypothetical protein
MNKIIFIVLSVAFTLLIFVGLLDWFGGCGESYVQADGSRIMGECLGREMFFGFFK